MLFFQAGLKDSYPVSSFEVALSTGELEQASGWVSSAQRLVQLTWDQVNVKSLSLQWMGAPPWEAELGPCLSIPSGSDHWLEHTSTLLPLTQVNFVVEKFNFSGTLWDLLVSLLWWDLSWDKSLPNVKTPARPTAGVLEETGRWQRLLSGSTLPRFNNLSQH